jgi:hypothetical protein
VERALRAAHSKLRFTISVRLAVEHPATGRMVGSADSFWTAGAHKPYFRG